MKFSYLVILFNLFHLSLLAQQNNIGGQVVNSTGDPVSGVSVYLDSNKAYGTVTDSLGYFRLELPNAISEDVKLNFSHVEYHTKSIGVTKENYRSIASKIILEPDARYLEEVEIKGAVDDERNQVSVTTIAPKDAQVIPSAFQDFNKILSTLPGVFSNNELSGSYAVRGGNFDENLVYVNDIPIYRPFLVRTGQQEGLSFVNPDMVSAISFSSGGWQPKYGDKLSSSLNITYKNPKRNSGSLTLGLLGGAFNASIYSPKSSTGVVIGIRHKNSRYLLNTLETSGEYLPSFTDIQLLLSTALGNKKKTSLEVLSSYARNRYFVKPESQETVFGTFSQSLRLSTFFEGNELMEYDTYQTGIKLSHIFSQRFVSDIILSGVYTLEREHYDIEGAYRLCDVNNIPGGGQQECLTIRGVGTNYRHARNNLNAAIFNFESRNKFYLDSKNLVEFGVGITTENIRDHFREFDFSDSSDYVTINHAVNSTASLSSARFIAYTQNTTTFNLLHTLTYGVRFNYWTLNKQFLVSPRIQYAYTPEWKNDVVFRAAIGVYQQPAFYRELRDSNGNINESIKAQTSFHYILGIDNNFKLWGRNFNWVAETYFKQIRNAIPYDVDNVRIRYAAENIANAYAVGVDVRVSGEFIEGAQSWFSLGILSTREDIEGDNQGYVRRPSDQRVNLGVYFQDHIPNDPSIRVYLSLLFGSGLPFGPPQNEQYRNAFTGRAYRRVDIGFSKIFEFEEKKFLNQLNSLWVGVEILNLLGTNNVLSYSWIQDVNNQQFAVPNTLSARFLNLKLIAKF